MIWVVGILGLIAGFALGQVILLRLLKDKTRQELLTNKSLHWQYGLLNWLIAAITSYASITAFRMYFPEL